MNSYPSNVQLSIWYVVLHLMCSSPSDVQLSIWHSAFCPTCSSLPWHVALHPMKGLHWVVKLSEFRPTTWWVGQDITEIGLFADAGCVEAIMITRLYETPAQHHILGTSVLWILCQTSWLQRGSACYNSGDDDYEIFWRIWQYNYFCLPWQWLLSVYTCTITYHLLLPDLKMTNFQ